MLWVLPSREFSEAFRNENESAFYTTIIRDLRYASYNMAPQLRALALRI